MCGIAGIYRRTEADVPKLNQFIDELLRQIAFRGRDATGYVAVDDDGSIQLEKSPIPVAAFIAKRRRVRASARTVLLHTRFATVGSRRSPDNAHPVVSGEVAAVHNGTIWNADELFQTFMLPRTGEVDSEIIPALINLAGWSQISAALGLLEGGAATAIINAARPRELVLARVQDFPLKYVVAKDFLIWASTEVAINRAWHAIFGRRPKKLRMASLKDGEMLYVEDGRIALKQFKYRKSTTLPTISSRFSASLFKRQTSVLQLPSAGGALKSHDLPTDPDDDELEVGVPKDWCDDCGEWGEVQYRHGGVLCPQCAASFMLMAFGA